MKKIFTLFLFTLISNFCFSQEPVYARAYIFSNGYRDVNTNEIVWNGKPTKCDILIRIDKNDLFIYSKTIQKYHVIQKINSNETTSVYKAVDVDGFVCNFYFGKLEDGLVYLSIEYSDLTWFYLITFE